jgi:hypothetical protein
MIDFLSLFAVLAVFISPVMAQENADDILQAQEEMVEQMDGIKPLDDGDYEVRLKLSQQMHEIWPMRQKIEGALDVVAERLSKQERLKFKTALRKSIQFDALEETSIEAMADIFTDKELLKMIEFYGSKEGRSVSYKTRDYEKALQPMMVKMMDKALLNAKMGTQSFPKK